MAKPEWGRKRIGPCGTKFYDFNKEPVICPGCGGEVITNEVKTKTKKNELQDNFKSNSAKEILSKDSSGNSDVLDSDILDKEIINDDSFDETIDGELDDNLSSDEEVNLIDDNNDIVLDVEINEDDK